MNLIQEFAFHLQQRSLSEHTIKCYVSDVEYFQKHLDIEEIEVLKATSTQIQNYLNEITRKYKPTTVQRKFATLSTFFQWLKKSEHISESPIPRWQRNKERGFQLPKKNKAIRLEISDSVISRLVDTTSGLSDILKLRNQSMIALMSHCGIRASELHIANIGDVQGKEMVIRRQNKPLGVVKEITVDISKATDYLNKYLLLRSGAADNEALFVNSNGSRLSTRSFRRQLIRHANAAGIGRLNPQQLIHSFALKTLKTGTSLKELQERLGHFSSNSTKLYATSQQGSHEN